VFTAAPAAPAGQAEQVVTDAVGLVDEIPERATGRNRFGDVALDDQASVILLHLLEEAAGHAVAQVKKLRVQPCGGDNDQIGVGSIGFPDQVNGILLRTQQGTRTRYFKQREPGMRDGLHVEPPRVRCRLLEQAHLAFFETRRNEEVIAQTGQPGVKTIAFARLVEALAQQRGIDKGKGSE